MSLIFIFYLFNAFSVESGKTLHSKTPFEANIIPLSGCTAIVIKPKWILTNAHCLKSDMGILQLDSDFYSTRVEQIFVHPKYQAFIDQNIKHDRKISDIHDNKITSHDVALIKLKQDKQFSLPNYPKLFTSQKHIIDDQSCLFYGYGAQSTFFDMGDWIYRPPVSPIMCYGENIWDNNLDPAQLQNIKKLLHALKQRFSNNIILEFSNSYLTTITDKSNKGPIGDVNAVDNYSNALPGDSGGPVFEKDKKGNYQIRGLIASGEQKTQEEHIVVYADGKIIKDIDILIEDNGSFYSGTTTVTYSKEVLKVLTDNNLLLNEGPKSKLKDNVEVVRNYKRTAITYVVDLTEPSNRSFIIDTMKNN